MDDCRAIKSLINSLYVPAVEMKVSCILHWHGYLCRSCAITNPIQEALLDLMFSVLRIKLPSFADAFLQGKRLTGASS